MERIVRAESYRFSRACLLHRRAVRRRPVSPRIVHDQEIRPEQVFPEATAYFLQSLFPVCEQMYGRCFAPGRFLRRRRLSQYTGPIQKLLIAHLILPMTITPYIDPQSELSVSATQRELQQQSFAFIFRLAQRKTSF
ncbi:hypothetical protein LJR296_006012 [Cupriavidus necator]|uniref:hypothetical protein n=1 Tax=Cupriavidus necator TaxID=106590 RepID=UPI003ECFC492